MVEEFIPNELADRLKISMNILVSLQGAHRSLEMPWTPDRLEHARSEHNRFGANHLTTENAEGHGNGRAEDSLSLDCFRAFPRVPWLKNSFPMNLPTASKSL